MMNQHRDSGRFAYDLLMRRRANAGVESADFGALELEADGDVDSVALERVLGVEFAIPLGENRQRL